MEFGDGIRKHTKNNAPLVNSQTVEENGGSASTPCVDRIL
jgi:hypothetical protein